MTCAPIALVAVGIAMCGAGPLAAKTLDACDAEYKANKTKIEGAQSQADFLAACQSGQAPVAGVTTSAKPAVPPAVAAQQPATPASAAGPSVKVPIKP